MGKYEESILAVLDAAIDRFRTAKALSEATGVSAANISRWRKGRAPRISEIAPILEIMGVEMNLPTAEPSKDVCFVNARVVPAGEHIRPPQAEDYIAAPLVGEVGAGPGYVAQDDVESWFLVYKHVPAIMHRRDLIAVEIGRHSTSMSPLLNPGDIVLVDRDDHSVERPGHIMLVRDPDGSGMIKRVAMNKDGDDWVIQFYSDNAAKNPPMIYRLNEDFDGDITKAVVGRVIWAWTDVRGK